MQNLATFEAMTALTFQFLQHNAQYQAGVTVTPNIRKGPDDMEIDALTKKGKGKTRERAKLMHRKRFASCADVSGSRIRAKAAHPTTSARKAKAKAKAKAKERTV